MSNFKKKLSALLALTATLQGGSALAAGSEQSSPPQGTLVSENNDLAELRLSKDELERRRELVNSFSGSVNQISTDCTTLLNHITVDAGDDIAGLNDPQYNQILESANQISKSVNSLAQRVSQVRTMLGKGVKGKVDQEMMSLDAEISVAADTLKNLSESWDGLVPELRERARKDADSERIGRQAAIRSAKVKINKVRNIISEVTLGIKSSSTNPTYSSLFSGHSAALRQLSDRMTSLETALTKSKTLAGCRALEDQAEGHVKEALELRSRYDNIVRAMSEVTYYSEFKRFETVLKQCQKTANETCSMNIDARIMTDDQRDALNNVVSEIRRILSEARSKLLDEKSRVKSANHNSLMVKITKEDKDKYNALVNQAVDDVNSQILTWASVLSSIQEDDLQRATWDYAEHQSIRRKTMVTTCQRILKNPDMPQNSKVSAIAAAINEFRPGQGTILVPLISAYLKWTSGQSRRVTDDLGRGSLSEDLAGFGRSEGSAKSLLHRRIRSDMNYAGEPVQNSKAPLMWLLSGPGGLGKTDGALNLAAALGAIPIIIRGEDLSGPIAYENLMTRIHAAEERAKIAHRRIAFIFDEVDVATCVSTDSGGRSLEYNPEEDGGTKVKKPSRTAEDVSFRKNWTLKLPGQGRNGAYDDSYGRKTVPALKGTGFLRRRNETFQWYSKTMEYIDRSLSPDLFAFSVGTSNYRLSQMPGEVARRISPAKLERVHDFPTAKQMSQIVRAGVPSLTFSDGYTFDEGVARIGELSEKYRWKADEVVSNILQLASAVRNPADTTCSIPCGVVCKLISGAYSFPEAVEETKRIDSRLKSIAAQRARAKSGANELREVDSDAETDDEFPDDQVDVETYN
jgi:hypothetical protein